MTNTEFVEKLKLALKSKTQYAMGGFGAPAGVFNSARGETNRETYIKKDPKRAAALRKASDDTFIFDCVCLGKGILWGWKGDAKALYGGANYGSNGVPDFYSRTVKDHCTSWSADMSPDKIVPGEWLLHSDGSHIGYYVGDGKVIESTAAGECKVQMSDLTNRKWGGRWIGHGKIKYMTYTQVPVPEIVCPCCGARFKKV